MWGHFILSARRNLQIEMKFLAGNHPCEKKPTNQDEIRGRKSSLREEISKSGWNFWEEIILGRRNLQIGMKFLGGNHPWEKKPANQDEFRGRKSSLRESFVKTGCIRSEKIIPVMKWPLSRSDYRKFLSPGKPHLYFSDSIWKELWFNSSRHVATLLFVDWLPTG